MGLKDRFDGTGTMKFGFILDGHPVENIKAVDNLTVKIDKVETKSVDETGRPVHKAYPGHKTLLGTLKVTRILNDNYAWSDWYDEALMNLPTARKTGTVTIYGNESQTGYKAAPPAAPVRSYVFESCWPTELTVTNITAASPNPIEESITFVYERMDILKP